MNRSIKLVFGITLIFSQVAVAQEIGILDLTTPTRRERLREPKGVGGGSCGGAEHAHYPEIAVSLRSLDRTQYNFGEDVIFEVKIQNIGKEPVILPWAETLADFEPQDSSRKYSYLKGTVSLQIGDGKQTFLIFDSFYGFAERPDTLKELRSGEWIVIKGRTQLLASADWVMQEFREESFISAVVRANLMLDNVTFRPKANHGEPAEDSSCINLDIRQVDQLQVTLFSHPSY